MTVKLTDDQINFQERVIAEAMDRAANDNATPEATPTSGIMDREALALRAAAEGKSPYEPLVQGMDRLCADDSVRYGVMVLDESVGQVTIVARARKVDPPLYVSECLPIDFLLGAMDPTPDETSRARIDSLVTHLIGQIAKNS